MACGSLATLVLTTGAILLWYACLAPIADWLRHNNAGIVLHAGTILLMGAVWILGFTRLLVFTILRLAKRLLICPACNAPPGELFNYGGRCTRCEATLIDKSAYVLREEWLRLPSEVHQTHLQKFSESSLPRKQSSRNNLLVALGLFGYLILLSVVLDRFWPARPADSDLLCLSPYAIFMIYWFWTHRLPPVPCPNCGENAYQKNRLLFKYHCNHCGAQLIERQKNR